MLKYLYCKEVFREIPDEITLGISISGCQIRCKGCHSRELWEDKGEALNLGSFQHLLFEHPGITCVCLFGGEQNIDELIKLLEYAHGHLKTAWYSGLDLINRGDVRILKHLDFVKLGHYDLDLGGLDSPTTNQRLYKRVSDSNCLNDWEDITYKLQKNEN